MNCFRSVLNGLSLNSESQGTGNEYAWLYLLLAYAANLEDGDPQDFENAYSETLARFAPFDGFAKQRLAQILNDGASK
jgi:hypothetical protein